MKRAKDLHEFNPMLGFRGCRLGDGLPRDTGMQARAVFEGAVEAANRQGKPVVPRGDDSARRRVDASSTILRRWSVASAGAEVEAETGARLTYQIGTMIELPRAALSRRRDRHRRDGAEFFSFGTNDLTQTCLGLSRDDAGADPRATISDQKDSRDRSRSCRSTRTASASWSAIGTSRDGRKAKPKLKIGICGEHGGDPASVAFCHQTGLTPRAHHSADARNGEHDT